MRILWVEDRPDHVVEEGDVVAVYATPTHDQRRLTAPFTGKVTKVFVPRGAVLKAPTALVEFTRIQREEPPEAVAPAIPVAPQPRPQAQQPKAMPERSGPHPRSLRRMPDAAVIDAIFDRILGPKNPAAEPGPAPSRTKKFSWRQSFAILALLLAGGAAYLWTERPDLLDLLVGERAYDGPMSRRAAAERQVDPSLLKKVTDMAPFGVGQGTLEIYQTPDATEYVYCPAVAVGPNVVAFAETCGRSVLDTAAAGGVAPTIYFRARRIRGETIESLVYPVTEVHRWLEAGDTGMVGLAIVAPADGGTLTDDTGRSGFAVIDPEAPPAYIQLDTAAASPATLMASRGCLYYTDTAPARDATNGMHAFTAKLDGCIDARESGYIRLPIDGKFYFGGFYVSDRHASKAEPGGEAPIAVWPQLFGSRDSERMAAAREGGAPSGSSVVRASGLPYPSGLYLANACRAGTSFYFRGPGSSVMQHLDVAGNAETRVANAPFSGAFLYSIGFGDPSDTAASRIEFNGEIYHMRRVNAVRGDVVLRNPPC
jgi:Pyruvate/2-oxoglutarate dehydrogenase complex, dihydrolipoamide acyltransferase (E2) component, and related enzymes